MSDFFRFPSTPHLAWLGHSRVPREDKILSPESMRDFLSGEVKIEEKLDGANLGISIGNDGKLRIQNRGQYLKEPYAGQFSRLSRWLELHSTALISVLTPNLIIFGEWCAARHSLEYSRLPDFFLMFDVYDKSEERFWNSPKRNDLAQQVGLITVPQIGTYSSISLTGLKSLITTKLSKYRNGQPLEGFVLRKESSEWCESRAKLVRPDFTQSIVLHWSKRAIEWNQIDYSNSDRR
ncbi:RNA ligase family protein [Escherichia albertii]|uniref:RNA ligase family protein n=1 Tax=Escherichia albertii TaxID=208962 RepID=UPI00169BAD15|nr:RNA ligase family protein [Escherichia albertii]MCQ8909597.1 RNA ligase family protein [Escherichia albertii]MCQ8958509.1 RNA ligase family protein [Escherichia albertii]MCQ8990138.1 RNA ligase family protein [Escherichia albertii]UUL29899.1 RNA ligase family protein [Escherichia albertii]UUL47002.1 RNA ligase family protein [Escherichia albertii]